MNLVIKNLLALSFIATAGTCFGQDKPESREDLEKIAKGLKYQQGEINLQSGLAKLNVPSGFRYLGPEDAETVLVKLWRNPPGGKSLGMLLPENTGPLQEDCWAVTISYNDDGYVKDNDASKINYTDLLKKMQEGAREDNKERVKAGYPEIELIGWAAPPRYDSATHKLYWAKEIQFGGEKARTLNYNIRILGRRGVLVLNVISGMNQLAEIEGKTPEILAMVDFNEGNRYADFDPKVDRIATYGLAALVAGGVAAKLGLFKMLWVFILAAKKFIILGAIAVVVWVKKLFGKGTQNNA
ncbi:MAG: DUF2167 domain-containing protein [Methylacidiphilales bacterium]|nr:DUF2167 domain-containing protein [Candidatus Methylacidiphilales bacterium]